MIANVRRVQAVMWLSDELMAQSEDGGHSEAMAVMRSQVRKMVRDEDELQAVHLVSLSKIEPHDLEFDHLRRVEGAVPPDCSPWVSVWEVRPV